MSDGESDEGLRARIRGGVYRPGKSHFQKLVEHAEDMQRPRYREPRSMTTRGGVGIIIDPYPVEIVPLGFFVVGVIDAGKLGVRFYGDVVAHERERVVGDLQQQLPIIIVVEDVTDAPACVEHGDCAALEELGRACWAAARERRRGSRG